MAGQHRLSTVVVHNRWWENNKHRNKQQWNNHNQGTVSSLFLKSVSNTHSLSHRRGKTKLEHQAIFFALAFLPPMLILSNYMVDAGSSSGCRQPAKKRLCQKPSPDKWLIQLLLPKVLLQQADHNISWG